MGTVLINKTTSRWLKVQCFCLLFIFDQNSGHNFNRQDIRPSAKIRSRLARNDRESGPGFSIHYLAINDEPAITPACVLLAIVQCVHRRHCGLQLMSKMILLRCFQEIQSCRSTDKRLDHKVKKKVGCLDSWATWIATSYSYSTTPKTKIYEKLHKATSRCHLLQTQARFQPGLGPSAADVLKWKWYSNVAATTLPKKKTESSYTWRGSCWAREQIARETVVVFGRMVVLVTTSSAWNCVGCFCWSCQCCCFGSRIKCVNCPLLNQGGCSSFCFYFGRPSPHYLLPFLAFGYQLTYSIRICIEWHEFCISGDIPVCNQCTVLLRCVVV